MASKAVIDVILGEAVAGDWDDMLAIASTMVNRAARAGVELEQVLPGYNATKPSKGTEKYREMAERALAQAMVQPSTTATHYYNPEKVSRPGWARAGVFDPAMQTAGHHYFTAPEGDVARTHKGLTKLGPIQQAAQQPTFLGSDVDMAQRLISAVSTYLGDMPSMQNGAFFPETQQRQPDPVAPAPGEFVSQALSGSKLDARAVTRDKLSRADRRSTPGSRNISLDFNANMKQVGVMTIIPDDATPQERAAAEAYNQGVVDFMAANGYPNYPNNGVKTTTENGRGKKGYFHTEPFFASDKLAAEIMARNPDGYAQVVSQTLGQIDGARFIAPHEQMDQGIVSTHLGEGKISETRFATETLIPALQRAGANVPEAKITDVPPAEDRVTREPNNLTNRINSIFAARPDYPSGMPAYEPGFETGPEFDTPVAAPVGKVERGPVSRPSVLSYDKRFSPGFPVGSMPGFDPARFEQDISAMLDLGAETDPSRYGMAMQPPAISPSLTAPQTTVAGDPRTQMQPGGIQRFSSNMAPTPRPEYAPDTVNLPDNWYAERVPFNAMPGEQFSAMDIIAHGKQVRDMVANAPPDPADLPAPPATVSTAEPQAQPDWSRQTGLDERMGNAGWSLYNNVPLGSYVDTQDRLQAQARDRDLARTVSSIIGEDARRTSVYTAPQEAVSTRSIEPPRAQMQAPAPHAYTPSQQVSFNRPPTSVGTQRQAPAPPVPAPSIASQGVDGLALSDAYNAADISSADPFGNLGQRVGDALGLSTLDSRSEIIPGGQFATLPGPAPQANFGQPSGNPVQEMVTRQRAASPANPFVSAPQPGSRFQLGAQLPPGTVVNGGIDPNTGEIVVASTGNPKGGRGKAALGVIGRGALGFATGGVPGGILGLIMGIAQNALGRGVSPEEAATAFGNFAAAAQANNPFSATWPGGMFGGQQPAGFGGGAPSYSIQSNGNGTFSFAPDGGSLPPGAAAAGWSMNNPERSPDVGYGSGYDPTPS
jgi:hypothetical protein